MIDYLLTTATKGTEVVQDSISQLAGKFGVEWHMLVAQVINFCVVALLLYQFAFKPVMKIVATRQELIAEGLRSAEKMKQKLVDADREYTEAVRKSSIEGKKIMDEARKNAKRFTEKQIQDTAVKTSMVIKKAKESINLEKQQMLRDSRKELSGLVVLATEKILNKNLSPEEKALFSDSAAKALAAEN